MTDKLKTATGVLEWARKTWPCDNPECRDTDNCVSDTATAERLALGQRVLAIVEREAKAGEWFSRDTLREANEVGDE